MDAGLDYLDHVGRESARFLDALRDVPGDVDVPSCPGWDADDLLWHLAEVQWFWGTIVSQHIVDAARVEDLKAERPTDHPALVAFYEDASQSLQAALRAASPETQAWTWSSDQTVGFIRRRQAHEALIHRVDAELTAHARTVMDPALCADGVDEVLRVMYGGVPPWGQFTPTEGQTLRVTATDTGATWLVQLGSFVGTDPETDTVEDGPDMRIADVDTGDEVAGSVSASAADLDCYLWHRETVGRIVLSGDEAVLNEFETTIGPGIN